MLLKSRRSRNIQDLYMICIMFIILNAYCKAQNEISISEKIDQLLNSCPINNHNFNKCMMQMFNKLTVFFKTGIPEYRINPFDPHFASYIDLQRGDRNGIGEIKLILRNVSEFGWSKSKVTKFQTDVKQQRIIYSQYFPEKSLNGWYEFTGRALGALIKRKGFWNMTLYDYSQTTIVQRLDGLGSPLKVNIQIDNIGDMQMHVSNIFANGPTELNNLIDGIINSMWPLGLPFIKPLINELISTAFTDIFNKSFRYFPIDRFFKHE